MVRYSKYACDRCIRGRFDIERRSFEEGLPAMKIREAAGETLHLPNTLYFGSAKRIDELKGRVFLTPHIGIASLFVIDVDDLFPAGYRIECNLSYRQWFYANERLAEPLREVNVLHNTVGFSV